MSFTGAKFDNILVETRGEKSNVGLITLNRPKALNALSDGLMSDLSKALDELEENKSISSIVITGSQKAFAGMREVLLH